MIGVVIVTYQSHEVIGRCLESCLQFGDLDVVVVDNASTDGTVREVQRFGNVRLIANPKNLGFAAAVNQGVAMTQTSYVLILNPDTELLSHPSLLAEHCDGAAGGSLVNHDGTLQQGFSIRGFPTPATLAFETLGINRVFPGNAVNRRYRPALPLELAEVDQPAGAFLMIRREAWTKVGGFDEAFFPVWFEDVDFCFRLKQAGYSIRYVPEAKALHIGGHSATKISWQSRQTWWYGSLLRYAVKHFSPVGRFLVAASVAVGAMLRMGGEVLLHRNLIAVSVYSRVMGFAALTAVSGRGRRLGCASPVHC